MALFLFFPVTTHAIPTVEKMVYELGMGEALPALAALFFGSSGRS
jgi:hypothetical protein